MNENGSTRISLFQETERTGEDDEAEDGNYLSTASESARHHGIVSGLDMICFTRGTHILRSLSAFLCQAIRENISTDL